MTQQETQPKKTFLDDLLPESTLDAAVLRGPVVGAESIKKVVAAVGGSFSTLNYTHHEVSGAREVVEYEGELPSGQSAYGSVTVTRNESGGVVHVSSMIRPFDAVVAIATAVKEPLAGHIGVEILI